MLKEKIENLSNEELHQCYLDIKNYNEVGFMGDTLVRQIRNEMALELNSENFDVNCMSIVIPSILLEIANRHYR